MIAFTFIRNIFDEIFIKFQIDSWKHDFPSDLTTGLSLANALKFSFGGPYIADISDRTRDNGKIIKYNYTGCLSSKFYLWKFGVKSEKWKKMAKYFELKFYEKEQSCIK